MPSGDESARVRLIFGLGNPGHEYASTRHNVGWLVIDELARRWNWELTKIRFDALCADGTPPGMDSKVLLAKPTTYMNLSGRSVLPALNWHKADPKRDLLVVSDDLDLPPGRLRMRSAGSAGGQKGLAHLISVLGHDQFARLRVGIGRPAHAGAVVGWVLSKPAGDDAIAFSAAVRNAADGCELWLKSGVEKAMNQVNAAVA